MAVTRDVRDGVGIITLNRPEARNAVNGDVARGIEEALDAFEADGAVRAIVLTGTGEVFSAGADLKAAMSDPQAMETDRGGFAGIVKRKLTTTTIAAVNGPALGGGFEIALSCDLVVAAEQAVFGLPEVKRGLIAGAGGLFRVGQRLPRAIALELVMTGDPIDAARAQQAGLVNRVVPTGQEVGGAIELAHRVTINGPVAVRLSRDLVVDAPVLTEEQGWERTQQAVTEVLESEDFREGIQAFLEKREPRWSGR